MLSKIYFQYRTQRLPAPLAVLLVVALSYMSFQWPIAAGLICLTMMLCASFWYPGAYLKWLMTLGGVAISLSLMSLAPRKMLFFAVRCLALGHLSILLFYLVPPASIGHPIIRLSLCLLPYFELKISNMLLAASVKGLPLGSRNPVTFVRAATKLFVPVMVSLLRTISGVEMALKIKGVELSGGPG